MTHIFNGCKPSKMVARAFAAYSVSNDKVFDTLLLAGNFTRFKPASAPSRRYCWAQSNVAAVKLPL